MSIHKTEALVINRFNFRETSLIATFFTRDFGKMSGILKGIRTDIKKFASPLDLFSLNEIIFYKKRDTSLHLVSHCDLKDDYPHLRQTVAKMASASVMMELVSALMPVEDANEAAFDLTCACLNELQTNANPDKIITIYKIKLLSLSGFKPNFNSCVACDTRITGDAKFSLNLGGLLCVGCFRKDIAARVIFRGTIASIVHIQKNDFRTNLNLGLNPQIKRELTLILNSFLHYHLEKQLKSEKVLQEVTS
jgi:DNA repair protein RecO (recombination protein O)